MQGHIATSPWTHGHNDSNQSKKVKNKFAIKNLRYFLLHMLCYVVSTAFIGILWSHIDRHYGLVIKKHDLS